MKTRLFTSLKVKNILAELESRTKLTPNILCRYGIIMSLKLSEPLTYDYDSYGQEFHRVILTGDYDLIFKGLILQKENRYIGDDEYFSKYLKAHLERGIPLLQNEIQICGGFDNFINEFFDPNRGGTI